VIKGDKAAWTTLADADQIFHALGFRLRLTMNFGRMSGARMEKAAGLRTARPSC